MQKLDDLMQKEMTRKEFLATVGFGVATILGFSNLIRMIWGKNHHAHQASYGYGGGAYGGAPAAKHLS